MNALSSIFSPRKPESDKPDAEHDAVQLADKMNANLEKQRIEALPRSNAAQEQKENIEPKNAAAPTTPAAANTSKPLVAKPSTALAPPADPYDFAASHTDEASSPQPQEDQFEFVRFKGHRWAGDTIEVEVEWDKGPATWEPEENLHRDAPDALFDFWTAQGGRPANPRDPELYNIFAVLKHSKDRKRVLVEWTGFGPKDATWMARPALERAAPDLSRKYWRTVGDEAPAPRRAAAKATTERTRQATTKRTRQAAAK